MKKGKTSLRATGIFVKTSYTEGLLLNIPNKTQYFCTFDDVMELPESS